VALLNTLGKLLELIIATRLLYILEERGLLPTTHLGGRKLILVDHAIQQVIKAIRGGWGRGLKVSMLLMDISRAYDNVAHERLVDNIGRLGLGWTAPWIASFLQNRATRLLIMGTLSNLFSTPTGIPQGLPISPILFLIYNTPLIQACTGKFLQELVTTYGWVDDTCALVASHSYAVNTQALEAMLVKADTWAKRHALKFAPDKFELLYFTNPNALPDRPVFYGPRGEFNPDIEYLGTNTDPVRYPGTATLIRPTKSARYLGVYLDKALSFKDHRQNVTAKASGSLEALRSIASSTWGASIKAMRMIYQGVVVPQLLWGVAAWYSPGSHVVPAKQLNQVVTGLIRIQRRAAILISGAFKSTAGMALDIELFMVPIRLRMQQIIEETAIRLRTGPEWARPPCFSRRRSAAEARLGGLTPLEALSRGPRSLLALGKGWEWETREAFVTTPWEPLIQVTIPATKTVEEALRAIGPPQPGEERYYTDGSGYLGHVGGAAVNPVRGVERQRYLGTEGDSSVYAGELTGVDLALKHANWL
jgi:hypothetical protein